MKTEKQIRRIVRYAALGDVTYGCISEDEILGIEGDVFGQFEITEPVALLSEVKLLPPCLPTKIVGLIDNYASRIAEPDVPPPTEPLLFLKPPSSLIGPLDSIVYPAMSREIQAEVELVIVMGRRAKDVTAHEARSYILGYTCGNDVTAMDLIRRDGRNMRGSPFDTFTPLGPCIATGLDPADLRMRTRINGRVVQGCSTKDIRFGVYELVSFVSQMMTLEPGDVVLTGTPPGASELERGDDVEVEIEGIGVLRNTVV